MSTMTARVLVVIRTIVVPVICAISGCGSPQPSTPGTSDLRGAADPFRPPLAAIHRSAASVDADQMMALAAPLFSVPERNLSDVLHLLKLARKLEAAGQDTAALSRQLARTVLDETTNAATFGERSFRKTRYGIRCKTLGPGTRPGYHGTESHKGQALATLLESGLDPVEIDSISGQTGFLGSLLSDSLACFDLDRDEIEWSALAFTMATSSTRGWKDKLGRVTTFEGLATSLLDRLDLYHEGTCRPIHNLYCLTVMYRISLETNLLRPEIASKIKCRLSRAIRNLAKVQRPDGSIDYRWYAAIHGEFDRPDVSEPAQSSNTTLINGHMAEWLIHVPNDMICNSIDIDKLLLFVLSDLGRAVAPSRSDICPRSHAIMSLLDSSIPGESSTPSLRGMHSGERASGNRDLPRLVSLKAD